ncbi:hypothetical protein BZA70DRAFT_73155 [Myxozyma melibiosi]|uniref:NAD-dependent epimerase/dehydratase domain-containing protein n=1 Tax=Myxozyma melibiosi TaxID=54550 RepID=A0ABR1F073_9ASCO
MAKVLLTGASGFLAGWVLRYLLEKDYSVVATVRFQEKADYLKSLYPNKDLTFILVPDMSEPTAFDEAVKGVDYVVHTASPFHFKINDPVKDMLDPAIKGTTNILASVNKYGPQVKKVVITSSFAAIQDYSKGARPGHVYDETQWNPATWEEACTLDPHFTYCASKAFSEKAAWDFMEKEKPSFPLTTITPPMILGPMLHDVSPETINTSSSVVYSLMKVEGKTIPPTRVPVWVDVRNVAMAHVLALDNPVTDNQRYLVSAGNITWEQICIYLRKAFPELEGKVPTIPDESEEKEFFSTDNTKSIKDMGIEYISLEQSIYDLAKQLIDWVK